ncbi:MAG: hypothetical protein G4V63_32505, partial [Candidatus Afipia apatlaquensis]|nr:hypothetical protein [Candidatus Afipia apatlaquensis]
MLAPFFDRDFVCGPIETGFRADSKIQGARIDAKGRLLFCPAEGYIDVSTVESGVGDDGRGMAGKSLGRPDGAGVIGREADSPAVIHNFARREKQFVSIDVCRDQRVAVLLRDDIADLSDSAVDHTMIGDVATDAETDSV